MAMTKKEQSAMADLQRQLREALAFRRTAPVARDLPPPRRWDELSKGWDFNVSSYGANVYKACSSSIHHGQGWENTSTQQPRALFSTEARAYAAMRWEVEERAARNLAEIDRRLAEFAVTYPGDGSPDERR